MALVSSRQQIIRPLRFAQPSSRTWLTPGALFLPVASMPKCAAENRAIEIGTPLSLYAESRVTAASQVLQCTFSKLMACVFRWRRFGISLEELAFNLQSRSLRLDPVASQLCQVDDRGPVQNRVRRGSEHHRRWSDALDLDGFCRSPTQCRGQGRNRSLGHGRACPQFPPGHRWRA